MGNIRDRAREILKAVPLFGQQINSNGPTAAQFTKLTGTAHATLVKNWEGGGIMTCCNGFVGWYATQLGSTKYLGRFDLESFLPTIGKGHAWIKSTSNARPKFGDILRHTAFHVDVALDFEGDILTRAASGQGGKKVGYDITKRVRGTSAYDHKNLQGWVDIELYFDSSSPKISTPQWLLGWWKVAWRGAAYYYYFDRNNQVKWTHVVPLNTSLPPRNAKDTGSVAIESLEVTIRWGATGSVEKLSRSAAENAMKGTWNAKEPLAAVKM